jgi:hypothetical protein
MFRRERAKRQQESDTRMGDYLAMFGAVVGYGAFFYLIWTMQ